jgi:methylmalonyl-CoA/ethylmalonyl-CoA epimerase
MGLTDPILLDGYEKSRTEFRGNPSEARAKLIIFDLGQVSLEIIEPIGTGSTWSEFLETRGEGIHHLAFTLLDADQTAKACAEKGVSVLQRGLFEGGKYVYLDVEKTLGFVLELLEFNSR